MRCIDPDEILEGDLLAYVEGAASQQVRDHIARCPFCAAEAASLAHVDRLLSAALYREDCPATEMLVQYQAGLLPTQEKRQIAQHIELCSLCSDELQRIAALDAPQRSLWEELRRSARTVLEALHIEPPAQLAHAVRGDPYHPHLYRVNQLDITLGTVTSQEGGSLCTVKGRVTHHGIAVMNMTGQSVRLVRRDRIVDVQAIDELGYFSFDRLAPDEYDVWVETAEADIVVRRFIARRPGTGAL
jgi:hypothetical protein